MELVSAISRSSAGEMLGTAKVYATAEEALTAKPDVFVEYTKPDVAKANILAALAAGEDVNDLLGDDEEEAPAKIEKAAPKGRRRARG